MDVEALAEQIRSRVGSAGSEVSPDESGRSPRILWVTGADQPNIGIITVPELADVQILCDEFTFDSVSAEVAPEFVGKLVAEDAAIVKRGRLLKAVVLQVTVAGWTYEASRSAKEPLSDWEQRLLANP
jgi:hypothetical protein